MMNKAIITFLASITFLLFSNFISAQATQTIRGTVIDKTSENPLVGAAIVIDNAYETMATSSDENGAFEIQNVPTGRHEITISYIGYNTTTLPNIVVNAGKETVLELKLDESVKILDAVTITSKNEKSKAVNELATISARQFNVEEVQRYSGGRNDVSRLVANFAGVATNNDSRNDIVIRGNSPAGVLWRLEGIPIPNPNHFATLGSTGGPVSALNPNMIKNSDFLTSAFPAEYGNAMAGVFDIGLRQGNKEKLEITAQLAAFSGLEAMIEGPFNKKDGGSFVVAYRHSFVELAQKAGINVGTTALPAYKDLTFNVDFGLTKLGKISIFGIGALSNISFLSKDVDSSDFFSEKGSDSYANNKIAIIGLKHNLLLNNSTYIRTILSFSNSGNTFDNYDYLSTNERKQTLQLSDFISKSIVSSFVNKKFNAKWNMRSGLILQHMKLDINTQVRDTDQLVFRAARVNNEATTLTELYSQWQYKPIEDLLFNAGVHFQYLSFNNTNAIEPRLAVNYRLNTTQSISLGYGLHSQLQSLPILLDREKDVNNQYIETNKNLDFSRSQHIVLGYDIKPSTDWHGKVEVYYQFLDKIAVETKPTSYSALNTGADFGIRTEPFLQNKGTGDNYGLEMTVEKYFSKGWYMLATASIFDAKYVGSDLVKRNTAFNSNYIANTLVGKEFRFGANKKNAFTIDSKLTWAGGRYVTPIDLAKSKLKNEAVYDETQAYSVRQSPYFRWDIKFGITMNSNKRKFTQQFFLDFQNVTNNQNIFQQRYSKERAQLYNVYQIGFFPDIMWRVQF
jgi:Carboxypeptidase regulatory-like domain/TonB-dependent Receptor Plug Domain